MGSNVRSWVFSLKEAVVDRYSKGRFVKGNKAAIGNRGNPNPSNQFQPLNEFAVKHGGYSEALIRHAYMLWKAQKRNGTPAPQNLSLTDTA